MKPLNRKNYGSIPHLSNSKLGIGDHYVNHGQERILTEKKRDKHDEILVFEKYDGSNVGIGKMNNKIFALTRSGYEARTSPYSQHHVFHKWVQERLYLFDKIINEGERITGEWLAQAHGLKYCIHKDRDPIVFFDYFNLKNERQSYKYLLGVSEKYGLQMPRLLHFGEPKNVDDLKSKLNDVRQSLIKPKEEMPEGMVYRVERKGKVDFLAKWVRSDFEAGKYIIDKEEDELVWNIRK